MSSAVLPGPVHRTDDLDVPDGLRSVPQTAGVDVVVELSVESVVEARAGGGLPEHLGVLLQHDGLAVTHWSSTAVVAGDLNVIMDVVERVHAVASSGSEPVITTVRMLQEPSRPRQRSAAAPLMPEPTD